MSKVNRRGGRRPRLLVSLAFLILMRGAGTVVSFLVTAVIAQRFGTSATADSLLAVRRVIMRLCDAGRSISTDSLVPFFADIAATGDKPLWNRSLLRYSLGFGAIGLIAALFMSYYSHELIDLLSPGFDQLRRQYAVHMQSIFAFMLPACFSLGVLTAAANTRGQYGFPDALQLLPRLLALGALLALPPPRAASFLPWSYVIGSIAAVFVLPLFIPGPTRRTLERDHLPLPLDTKNSNDRKRTQIRSRLWALVFSLLGLQITSWLQIRYATKVGAGTITYLELSQTVMAVLPSVILRAASSIAYAEAAHNVADKGPNTPSKLLKNLIELGLFLMLPVIIFIATFSEEISRLLFVRGHFSADDGRHVASLIVAFSAGSVIAAVQHALNVCFLLEKDLPLGKLGAIQLVAAVSTHWTLLQLLYSPYGMFALPIAVAGSGAAVVALRFTLINRWRQEAISMFADFRIWKILALAGGFTVLALSAEGFLSRQPEASATFAFVYLVLASAAGGAIYLFGGYLLGIWTPSMLRGKSV